MTIGGSPILKSTFLGGFVIFLDLLGDARDLDADIRLFG
jgi:hypothetical protein